VFYFIVLKLNKISTQIAKSSVENLLKLIIKDNNKFDMAAG